MHQVPPQGALHRPQAHREIRTQGKHDEMEGTAKRRLPKARCTQHARALRLGVPRSAESVMKELEALAEILAEWADPPPGILNVILFGSRVRGDHKPDSDVQLVRRVCCLLSSPVIRGSFLT